MMRLILAAIVFSFCVYLPLTKTVQAGFEWVPPANQVNNEIVVPSPDSSMGVDSGFPPPEVFSEPLPDHSVMREPMSILPQEERVPIPALVPATKNLSGKKLVIDPYPLRRNKAAAAQKVSMIDTYKAMNEKSGNLHPVQLGNGLSTGAKKQMVPVPKAVRMASTTHKTFLTPTSSGMTPMMGKEPDPLPGTTALRAPVEKVVPSIQYSEAVGFGRDLPLALALSQVIPAEFTHSFAKDVDAGSSVSWEGGKPWNRVLEDMLRPKGMSAVIQGNQVIIQNTAKL